MKIMLIDVVCKEGSTGKLIYDLYTEYNAQGFQTAICYGRGKKIKEKNITKISSNLEVYFHVAMSRLTGLNGYFSFFSTRRLLKKIKQFKPDIVHIHELHGYYVNLKPVIKYLKQNKIKTIWTFHCEYMYTGKCGQSLDCNKWQSECYNCPQLHQYPKSIFFDFTRQMHQSKKNMLSDFENLTIVTPSVWLEKRVKESFLNDKSTKVIHNGIDLDNVYYFRDSNYLKDKHNITNEKVVLAVAPNLMSVQKGGHFVLELANRLVKENIKFILIGVDKPFNFQDNVIMLGRTNNQDELAEYYSLADVFIICSQAENFPTTCLESLACGTPVIGFDVGGTKETAPNNLGHFVSYEDLESLEQAVLDYFNGKLSLADQDECILYAKNNYNKKDTSRNYLKLYKEILSGD